MITVNDVEDRWDASVPAFVRELYTTLVKTRGSIEEKLRLDEGIGCDILANMLPHVDCDATRYPSCNQELIKIEEVGEFSLENNNLMFKLDSDLDTFSIFESKETILKYVLHVYNAFLTDRFDAYSKLHSNPFRNNPSMLDAGYGASIQKAELDNNGWVPASEELIEDAELPVDIDDSFDPEYNLSEEELIKLADWYPDDEE